MYLGLLINFSLSLVQVTRMKAEEAARKAGHDGEYDNIDGYVDTQITDTQ